MTLEKQIETMEKQIACFDSIVEKLAYLHNFFKPDPSYSQEAMDVVLGNLSREMAQEQQ